MSNPELSTPLERLASLEHDQWVEWSSGLASKELLTGERLDRWKRLWATPYADLTEDEKEQDRKWARLVLAEARAEAVGAEYLPSPQMGPGTPGMPVLHGLRCSTCGLDLTVPLFHPGQAGEMDHKPTLDATVEILPEARAQAAAELLALREALTDFMQVGAEIEHGYELGADPLRTSIKGIVGAMVDHRKVLSDTAQAAHAYKERIEREAVERFAADVLAHPAIKSLLAYGASPPEYPGLVLVPKSDVDAFHELITGEARSLLNSAQRDAKSEGE